MNVETLNERCEQHGVNALQLSHVHSNVETSENGTIATPGSTLQLSHVHSNVET